MNIGMNRFLTHSLHMCVMLVLPVTTNAETDKLENHHNYRDPEPRRQLIQIDTAEKKFFSIGTLKREKILTLRPTTRCCQSAGSSNHHVAAFSLFLDEMCVCFRSI